MAEHLPAVDPVDPWDRLAVKLARSTMFHYAQATRCLGMLKGVGFTVDQAEGLLTAFRFGVMWGPVTFCEAIRDQVLNVTDATRIQPLAEKLRDTVRFVDTNGCEIAATDLERPAYRELRRAWGAWTDLRGRTWRQGDDGRWRPTFGQVFSELQHHSV